MISMAKARLGAAAFFLVVALLFLAANLGAYRGYFQGDDLDTLGWTHYLPFRHYLTAAATPLYIPSHFRPVGHVVYWILDHTAGFRFAWYIAFIQALHILNLWLLWRLMRNLGFAEPASALGTLFFAFQMATLDAYWKPQFVFDVLCATFSLASLLCYIRKKWILSFLCFWLAYKAKELAVMLPVVLACYEFWLGEKRWKRLLPFFLVSLSFGLQGIVVNHRERAHTLYALHFSLRVLWQTSSFYASKLFMVRYLGFAVLALPLFVRDRRLYFGIAALCLFLVPLLALPGRLAEVYLYLPLAGAAIAFAVLATRQPAAAGVFLALWLPWSYLHSRSGRHNELTLARENRAYVGAVRDFMSKSPGPQSYLFDGYPRALAAWGVRGALSYFGRLGAPVCNADDADFQKLMPDAWLLSWDAAASRLNIREIKQQEARLPYIDMRNAATVWQLGDGWLDRTEGYRWTQPRAAARLYRPPDSQQFEVRVNVLPLLVKDIRQTRLSVFLDDRLLGTQEFSASGWQTVQWDLPPGPTGFVEVEFRSAPPYRPSNGDPRTLGIAIGGFGFAEER